MNIFKRFLNRKHKKDKIDAYNKGRKDNNNVRDRKEYVLKKIFKEELGKKDKTIKKLKKLLKKSDDKNIELSSDMLKLKEVLLRIENFVETKQLNANTDALRKITLIQTAESIIHRIEKKLPDVQEESGNAVIESEIEVVK